MVLWSLKPALRALLRYFKEHAAIDVSAFAAEFFQQFDLRVEEFGDLASKGYSQPP